MSKWDFDVIVAGGGLGGTVAAIAAARAGARTVLLEKASCLGGTATKSMVCELDGSYKNGRCMLPSIGRELVDHLLQVDAAKLYGEIPMSSNPGISCDRIRFHPEYMKLVLDQMVRNAGVTTLFLTQIKQVAQDNFGVCVTAGNLYESIDITGKVLIDATGNSEAVYQLSPQATEKTPKEQQQGVTMMFALSNVDMPRFLENLDRDKLAEIIRRGIEAKAFPYRIFAVCPLPGTQSISVNMTRVPDVDVESIEDMSAALMEARSQIQCAVPYICKNVRGCEKAYLSSIASSLGVRERRKIVGQQLLKGEDLVQCTSFSDAVALGSYPVDIHRSDSSHAVQFVSIGGSGIYEIPFHCMVTKQFGNVLAGGKNVYADDMAFGAMRTMPTVMGIGNAAGLAAAAAARGNHDLRTMSIEPVQETLRKVDYPDSAERF